MNPSRRILLTNSVAATLISACRSTGGAIRTAHAPACPDDSGLMTKIDIEGSARQVRNCMNRYATLSSIGDFDSALKEFALDQGDVQADFGFGACVGAEPIRRLFEQAAKRDNHTSAVMSLVACSTTEILEVAADALTAKGLWLCPTAPLGRAGTTTTDAGGGYRRRAADFIYVDHHWRIWHYLDYGPGDLKVRAVAPPSHEASEAVRSGIEVKLPVPYKTFLETFSYGVSPSRG